MFSVLMEPVVHDFEGEVAYSAHWLSEAFPPIDSFGFTGALLVDEYKGSPGSPDPLGVCPFWFPMTWDDITRSDW